MFFVLLLLLFFLLLTSPRTSLWLTLARISMATKGFEMHVHLNQLANCLSRRWIMARMKETKQWVLNYHILHFDNDRHSTTVTQSLTHGSWTPAFPPSIIRFNYLKVWLRGPFRRGNKTIPEWQLTHLLLQSFQSRIMSLFCGELRERQTNKQQTLRSAFN